MAKVVSPRDVKLGNGATGSVSISVGEDGVSAKGKMPKAVAEQIAVIRAEMGLTGTGIIDELANEDFKLGMCGDLCSSIGDMCKVRVHGNCLDGLIYRLVVFFATLFKKSPLGAAAPDGTQRVDGMLLPALGAPEHAPVLQRIARDVVMPHLDTWWGKYARDGTDAVSPAVGPVPDS